MKVTSAVASKIIRELNERIDYLYQQENQNSTYEEIDGISPVVPEYDYAATRAEISDLCEKVRNIKHAVNVFNSQTHLLNGDATIDTALVEMAQLNAEIKRLGNMRYAKPKVMSGTRARVLGGVTAATVQYTVANFDVSHAEDDYRRAVKALRNIQTGLDRVNNTVEFEIPYNEADLGI